MYNTCSKGWSPTCSIVEPLYLWSLNSMRHAFPPGPLVPSRARFSESGWPTIRGALETLTRPTVGSFSKACWICNDVEVADNGSVSLPSKSNRNLPPLATDVAFVNSSTWQYGEGSVLLSRTMPVLSATSQINEGTSPGSATNVTRNWWPLL